MYKEHCMKKCLDVNVVMELLGLQSMKLSLPQNYNSSDEEKIKQVYAPNKIVDKNIEL